MKLSDLKNSRYLTKEDAGDGIVVTFSGFRQDNVAPPDQPAEMKWLAEFEEDIKPLVLGPTTGSQIAACLGGDNSDDWVGKKVILFNDPTVMFSGKAIGGTRVRKYTAPRSFEQAVADSSFAQSETDVDW